MSRETAQAITAAGWPILIGVALICIGIAESFLGWKLYKKKAYVYALLAGLLLGYGVGTALATAMQAPLDRPRGLVYQGLGAAIGALSGAILARPMERLLAFAAVGAAGAIPGVLLLHYGHDWLGAGVAAVGFLLAGSLALKHLRALVIVGTAFLGSFAVVWGVKEILLPILPQTGATVSPQTALVLVGLWLVVFAVGAKHQFKHGPPEAEEKE